MQTTTKQQCPMCRGDKVVRVKDMKDGWKTVQCVRCRGTGKAPGYQTK